MSIILEVWKPISGFDGYEISNMGRVRSWKKRCRNARTPTKPRLLKPTVTQYGYFKIMLYGTNQKTGQWVHRLVLENFVGPSEGRITRHLNGVRLDNRAINLKWGSPKENSADRITHDTLAKGERHGFSKLTASAIRDIRKQAKAGVLQRVIAKKYGIVQQTVSGIVTKIQWRHV